MKAMSSSIARFIRARGFSRVVFASSYPDIVPWLQPGLFLAVLLFNFESPHSLTWPLHVRLGGGS